MSEAFDWSWLRQASAAPAITLDTYLAMPEDLARTIEVADGVAIHCESPSEAHQGVEQGLLTAIGEAVRKHDQRHGSCHKTRVELDVLISDVPRLNFRRPDVVVYRCLPEDRSERWRNKPLASDLVVAIEVVSGTSISTDLDAKRRLYARSGIPHYWIVRMASDDGPAISVERLRLTDGGQYASEFLAFRSRDRLAVDSIDPFEMTISWAQLDEWL